MRVRGARRVYNAVMRLALAVTIGMLVPIALAGRVVAQDVPPPPAPPVQVVEAPPVQMVEAPPAYGGGQVVVVQPGYSYGTNPVSVALRAELAQLQPHIDEYSLGGPIVATSVGGGAFILFGSLWLLYAMIDELTGDYSAERLGFGIGAIAGAGLLTAGLAWLFSNIGGRRPYARRKKEIILQLRAMGEQAFDPAFAPVFRF